jgi:hypothetical protein
MTGSVYGTGTYILGGMGVSVKMQAITSTSCQTEKYSWYYERVIQNDTTNWSKGALYWYIKVGGTDIPENTIIKDKIASSDHKLVENESFAGIYVADSNAEFSKLEDLKKGADVLDENSYEVIWDMDNNEVSFSFANTVNIPEDKVFYIVIKTDVINYPNIGSTITYKNSLYQKIGDKSLKLIETAEKSIKGVRSTQKEAANVFTYDGGSTYVRLGGTSYANNGEWGNYAISGYKVRDKQYQMLTEAGTYIEYQISTCKDVALTGDITLSDVLPEGLELSFLRNAYFQTATAETAEIEELENDPAWKRYELGNKKDYELGNAGTSLTEPTKCIYYYNSTTREVRWRITNAYALTDGYINFQMVVKVVDPEVLMGVKQGVYVNSVKVSQNGTGFEETATAGTVTLSRNALSKQINGEASRFTIPFKIVVNELGEDLIEGKSSITLVDEMSESLTIDINSIKVMDAKGVEVKNVKIALEEKDGKTYLKLTVPDDMKLIITYDTKVNSPENTTVSISNVAYWEGYSPSPGTEVVNNSFTYNLKGMASVSGHAKLKLTKRDADDIMTTLVGAEYSMQEVKIDSDGNFQLVGTPHLATTNIDGVAYFSADDNYWMEYDKIYCLTETKAPEGYELDTTPHYILLASKDNISEYPSNVHVQRNSNQFNFDAMDSAKPTYAIPSAGGIGTYPIQLAGAVLLTASIGCGLVMRRKRRKEN